MAFQGYRFSPGEKVAIYDQETGKVVALRHVAKQDGNVVLLNDGSAWLSSGWPVRPPFLLRMTATSPFLDEQIERKRKLCEIAEMATMIRELADRYHGLKNIDLEVARRALQRLLERSINELRPNERPAAKRALAARISNARSTPIEEFVYDLKMAPPKSAG